MPRGAAVVTGGSAGVGRAAAIEFARRGYAVAVLARGRAGLEAAVRDVEQYGVKALGLEVDVADFDSVLGAAKQVEDHLGPIDVWVNDAMTTVFGFLEEVAPDEFKRATEVTYLGQVHGTMAALRLMEPRDRGTVVNVGSALAFAGIPLQAAYCGAKFACRGFFESVRAELLHKKSQVRIAMVHLPAVNTPQFGWCENKMPYHPQPVPPISQPEVPARRIVDAAERGRSDVVGSWNRLLVAVTAVAPTVVAHYAARTCVGAQQAGRPPSTTRPNLFQARDAGEDFGAHGSFDGEARGARSPQFLKGLPHTVAMVAGAVKDTVADRRESRSARRPSGI